MDYIIGKSKKIIKVLTLLKKVSRSIAPILIQGESGTGKELAARAIHQQSHLKHKPFIAIDCGALPEGLLESELFGHVKGAFTGANKDNRGLFKEADGGTLFLDEIGNMSDQLQGKVLRAIQEGEIKPVGSSIHHKVNVRLITASRFDLLKLMRNNKFREDLYYRVSVVTLTLPPLRERRKDIPLLVEHFIKTFHNGIFVNKITGISDDALKLLINYNWPGNIRELQNIITRAIIIADDDQKIITVDLIKDELERRLIIEEDTVNKMSKNLTLNYGDQPIVRMDSSKDESFVIELPSLELDNAEKEIILIALKLSSWVQKDAAVLLNISPRSLNYKIKQHNIVHASWKKNITEDSEHEIDLSKEKEIDQ